MLKLPFLLKLYTELKNGKFKIGLEMTQMGRKFPRSACLRFEKSQAKLTDEQFVEKGKSRYARDTLQDIDKFGSLDYALKRKVSVRYTLTIGIVCRIHDLQYHLASHDRANL